ncbi:MAG: hypothetical protein R3C97_15055 [Geminicoccaceae bacterium]
MSHFLATEEYPKGHRLESLLLLLRRDLVHRMQSIATDDRPEARHVLENDIQILDHLTRCIELAEDSSLVLKKAFGPSIPGHPRIGQ